MLASCLRPPTLRHLSHYALLIDSGRSRVASVVPVEDYQCGVNCAKLYFLFEFVITHKKERKTGHGIIIRTTAEAFRKG